MLQQRVMLNGHERYIDIDEYKQFGILWLVVCEITGDHFDIVDVQNMYRQYVDQYDKAF